MTEQTMEMTAQVHCAADGGEGHCNYARCACWEMVAECGREGCTCGDKYCERCGFAHAVEEECPPTYISTRLPFEDVQRVEAAATYARQTVADFVREAVLRATATHLELETVANRVGEGWKAEATAECPRCGDEASRGSTAGSVSIAGRSSVWGGSDDLPDDLPF